MSRTNEENLNTVGRTALGLLVLGFSSALFGALVVGPRLGEQLIPAASALGTRTDPAQPLSSTEAPTSDDRNDEFAAAEPQAGSEPDATDTSSLASKIVDTAKGPEPDPGLGIPGAADNGGSTGDDSDNGDNAVRAEARLASAGTEDQSPTTPAVDSPSAPVPSQDEGAEEKYRKPQEEQRERENRREQEKSRERENRRERERQLALDHSRKVEKEKAEAREREERLERVKQERLAAAREREREAAREREKEEREKEREKSLALQRERDREREQARERDKEKERSRRVASARETRNSEPQRRGGSETRSRHSERSASRTSAAAETETDRELRKSSRTAKRVDAPVRPATHAAVETTDDPGVFKVRIGRYQSREDAEKAREEITRSAGKEAVLVRDGSSFRLQIGAYKQKANADKVAEELRSRNFTPEVSGDR